MKVCKEPGCGKPVRCLGVCNRHYHQIKLARRMKPCGCGCGEMTAYSYKHGHHTRLFSSEEQARRGRQNYGDKLRDTGEGKTYRKVMQRHEHRRVAEQMLGRPLRKGEVVHHVNGNKRDNRPENLQVFASQAEHVRHHMTERASAQ